MSERIVSPGVYTREIDVSFLPGTIAQIGAAIVGPTLTGPAYMPTTVTGITDFESKFGGATNDSYVHLTVKDYFENGGNVMTITRLLYEDGYSLTDGALAIVAQSGSQKYVTHILHPTTPVSATTYGLADSVLNSDTNGNFELKLSGSYTSQTIPGFSSFNSYPVKGVSISASIVLSDSDYMTKVFSTNPKNQDYPVYIQYTNPYTSTLFGANTNLSAVSMSLEKLSTYAFVQDYKSAATPWITSQKIGSNAINLFKIHSLSHGNVTNFELKVGIDNIKTSVTDSDGYPRFDVVIRKVDNKTVNVLNTSLSPVTETDSQALEVARFANCSLNKDSADYIVKKIGDRYQTIDDDNVISIYGDYPNTNNYVRVEVSQGVADKTYDKSLFPFGFRALTSPIPNVSGSVNISAASYLTTQVDGSGVYNNTTYHGFDFSVQSNYNYLCPIPTSGSTTASNVDFYLGNVSQSAAANFPSTLAPYTNSLQTALTNGLSFFNDNIKIDTKKFIIPMQGGFDGTRPNLPKFSGENITATNTFGFDCSNISATGTTSYQKAFTLLSNTDYYDMNVLVTPGLIDSLHDTVTGAARNLCRDRQDAFYVMDSNAKGDTLTSVINQVRSIDNNYTATYWPWLNINNPLGGTINVPPSVLIAGVLAQNDAAEAPWYAPAGLSRGGITANSAAINLTQAQRDTLYENRVNPIASFPNSNIVVWGQKTLQATPSALDRVNVRRLLIAVKKFIASSTRFLVFDQNTIDTRERFLGIVNPYLQTVKQNSGLSAFRVVMDETNNTPDVIDRNILYGQLFLQPTRTAEFIVLDFNIQPTGAAF
jgi:hypothetical protein